jgi:anaerobic magnesium-protoporphyrin IX monomethyl ester cyclase
MRVVLLSTPTRVYTPNYIVPTGIISIAAYLEQCGHEVHVVDAAALREDNASIVRRVADFNPHLIGVGGIITAYAYIISLTHDLKKALPRVPIVLGGQVSINNEKNCFEHMALDYVVHGYGEIATEKILRHLAGELPLAAIPGISYVEGGAIVANPGREFFKNINELPLPAYHLIDMEHYATVNGLKMAKLQKYLDKTGKTALNHRFCTVMGTLGCTDRCTFCVHEQEYVGLKVFSNDYLIRHIRHLHETYDINVFAIGEEMFITKLARAREFNRLMQENFPNLYWSASTRADFVTPEMIAELQTGNCFYLAWGYESGSQTMLDRMKKRMSREQNMLAYTSTDNSPLVAACSLMVGTSARRTRRSRSR